MLLDSQKNGSNFVRKVCYCNQAVISINCKYPNIGSMSHYDQIVLSSLTLLAGGEREVETEWYQNDNKSTSAKFNKVQQSDQGLLV